LEEEQEMGNIKKDLRLLKDIENIISETTDVTFDENLTPEHFEQKMFVDYPSKHDEINDKINAMSEDVRATYQGMTARMVTEKFSGNLPNVDIPELNAQLTKLFIKTSEAD
jgi:hypothetical protein